jgi:hypothetical protein
LITIGIDPHKATHTAAAVSELGRQLAEITVSADERGQRELLAWAHGLGEEVRFALDEPVLRVGPRLMAGARKGARTRGKSDAIDALAIARAASSVTSYSIGAGWLTTSREISNRQGPRGSALILRLYGKSVPLGRIWRRSGDFWKRHRRILRSGSL